MRAVPSPDLESCLRGGRCQPLPGDWNLALADVEGSTLAIQAGRYKEANVVAASAIVGVLNALRDVDVPFVLGGDGATLAVPASALDAARQLAREQFGFSLRTALLRPSPRVVNFRAWKAVANRVTQNLSSKRACRSATSRGYR